jgi:hypothetical protein
MKFIEVTIIGGNKMIVNPVQIKYIEKDTSGCVLFLVGNENTENRRNITESYEDIRNYLLKEGLLLDCSNLR